MTRTAVAVLVLAVGGVLAGEGCGGQGVGDPCTPEQEYDSQFNGFDSKEVNVESKSFQCRTRVCLVNHFQGRVSCPYGQDSNHSAPAGASPCVVPGTTQAIDGDPNDTRTKAAVQPQCLDRTADKAVYCSCRCADINGAQPSGQTFCTCPDGYSCTQLVTSIGVGNEGLTGAYCIKSGTAYDANTACDQGTCAPNAHPCQ